MRCRGLYEKCGYVTLERDTYFQAIANGGRKRLLMGKRILFGEDEGADDVLLSTLGSDPECSR